MLKLLKNLEYLIPLFTGMPNWVKCLFVVWVIFSIALLLIIASIAYTKNKEKSLKEENYQEEIAKIKINRFIEDSQDKVEKIISEFPKNTDQINDEAQKKGMFFSGPHIRMLWEHGKEYKNKMDTEYRKLKRDIEDVILEHYKHENIKIIDDLKEENDKLNVIFKLCEEKKKEFEKPARQADLNINKTSSLISDDFEIR